jgi:hypothetical protein
LYLDSIQAVVCHVHAQEHSATCTPAKVLDHYILIYKGAASQLGQLQTAGLPVSQKHPVSSCVEHAKDPFNLFWGCLPDICCVCMQILHLCWSHSCQKCIAFVWTFTTEKPCRSSQLCTDGISCFALTSCQNENLWCSTMHSHNEKYTVDCLLAYFKGAESRLSVTPNSEVSRLRASTVLAFLSARASLVSLLPSPLENLSQSDSSSESLSDPKSERREACRGSRTLLGLYDTAKRSRCGVLLKW